MENNWGIDQIYKCVQGFDRGKERVGKLVDKMKLKLWGISRVCYYMILHYLSHECLKY